MSVEEKCALLAGEIARRLGTGITLSNEVINYIDSTFSNPSARELEAILRDDFNCEKESLLELLFFPDEAIQLQLEDLLERCNFQKKDEEAVWNYLYRRRLRIGFRFPDSRGPFELDLPPTAARRFIERLNISRQLPKGLAAAVDKYVGAEYKGRIKVKLRNARLALTENGVQFLADVFEKMDAESDPNFECLEFALSFLEALKEDNGIFEALMARKKSYLKNLQRTVQFEARLRKNNMETLMLQGKRAAFIDKVEARKKIDIIDRISRAVFGRTEYFEPPWVEEESIELRPDQDIQDIIRTLS